jgi:hypothetical protein
MYSRAFGMYTGKEGYGSGTYSVNESFVDYFMFLPRTEAGYAASIPVALGITDWGWTASLDWKISSWSWIAKPVLVKHQMSDYSGLPLDWACTLVAGT